VTRYALYVNLTEITGSEALAVKRAIRSRLDAMGARVTSIYRNPFSPERHRYRFLRVHYETKDDQ
jgi:hypothetical protein